MIMFNKFLAFVFLQYSVLTLNCSEIELSFDERFEEGKTLYTELTHKAYSYGDCWKQAISDLHVGCKHLTEEVQSRLALSFSNCFLLHAGSPTCPCSKDMLISDCLKNSSDRVFATYTEFFTHTQSICHYLQHRKWQEDTEKTVLMLTESSKAVSKKLDAASEFQSRILDLQNLTLQEQKRLISNGKILNLELQKSRSHARSVYEEFKSTTTEQKLLIFEIFDRVKKLQHFVLGEFNGVYTVAYYLGGCILIYLLTSIPRTADARLWLLLLISFNAVLERGISSYSLDEEMLKLLPLDSDGPMYYRIWLCRKITCFVGLIILIIFYYRYQDYNVINNQLLKRIQQQNNELQLFIKSLNLSEKAIISLSPSVFNPMQTVTSVYESVNTSVSKQDVSACPTTGFYDSPDENKTTENCDMNIVSSILKRDIAVHTPLRQETTKKLVTRRKNTKKTTEGKARMPSKDEDDDSGVEFAMREKRKYNLRSRTNSPLSPLNLTSRGKFSGDTESDSTSP